MGAALACARAQGEAGASPEASFSREPSQRNKGSDMSGPASDSDPGAQQVSIAPCAQEQQRSAPALDIAKTELARSASSSRDSSCHGLEHRHRSGLLRSTSSRDLDDGVREWEQPHVWHKKGPPASPCEPERLSTLRSIAPHGHLENLRHPKFGPLLDLACKIFGTDHAAVSLMDDNEMYILEGRGYACAGKRIPDAAAGNAFCCWSVIPSCASVLTVEDAWQDARFQSSPLVRGDAGIRFYIGAPLIASDGHRLGMMCVYDTKPRKVDANNAQIVCNLAELAARELEKNWALQMEWNNVRSALRCIECYKQGFMFLDLADPEAWQILYVSPEAVDQPGLPDGVLKAVKFWDTFKCLDEDQEAKENWLRAVQRDEGFSIINLKRRHWPDQSVPEPSWDSEFRPAAKETLSSSDCALIGIPSELPALISPQRLYVAELKRKTVNGQPAADSQALAAKESKDLSARKDCGRPQNIPFAGCEVGQLISEDGQVRFYRGLYHGNPVVLKVIYTSALEIKGSDDLALTSRVTTRLRHPCIVRTMLHCITEAPSSRPWDSAYSAPSLCSTAKRDACWMMLEYCDKGTLQDAIVKGAFLEDKRAGAATDIKAVVSAALEIAMGMAYLHGRDLIHGDLTGDSVWLQSGCTPQGFHCKVGCFALSRSAILARLEAASYTPIAHFPPELLKDKIITKAADAYAFGILMWELYTCSRAWANLTHVQVAKAVFTNRKLQWPASTPVKYRKLASACMAYDPEDRPMFSECVEQLHDMWAMYDRCGD